MRWERPTRSRKGPIQEQAAIAADAARREVLPGSDTFTELTAPEGLSEAYAGYDANGKLIGKTGKVVTKGYGGAIEITVGVDQNGTITGVFVGGPNFSETAGLGRAHPRKPGSANSSSASSRPFHSKRTAGKSTR